MMTVSTMNRIQAFDLGIHGIGYDVAEVSDDVIGYLVWHFRGDERSARTYHADGYILAQLILEVWNMSDDKKLAALNYTSNLSMFERVVLRSVLRRIGKTGEFAYRLTPNK